MKRLYYTILIAAIALLPVACEPEPVPNTGDQTGSLYGTWILDTKTVEYSSTSGGSTDQKKDVTDFTGDNFLLTLTDYFMAFGQEGTLLTFDIDDVDGTPYSYDEGTRQISFSKSITLSKGFLPLKVMSLSGTYDVTELTDSKLTIQQTNTVSINTYSSKQVTTYSYHRLVTDNNQ